MRASWQETVQTPRWGEHDIEGCFGWIGERDANFLWDYVKVDAFCEGTGQFR